MTATMPISNTEDILDVRDIIARFEAIEDAEGDEEYVERDTLADFLEDIKGLGGDEQWRGDWYPLTLIRDSYFEDYARELAEEIGAINHDASWPMMHIDWPAAAEALQQDYTSVEFDGVEYWTR